MSFSKSTKSEHLHTEDIKLAQKVGAVSSLGPWQEVLTGWWWGGEHRLYYLREHLISPCAVACLPVFAAGLSLLNNISVCSFNLPVSKFYKTGPIYHLNTTDIIGVLYPICQTMYHIALGTNADSAVLQCRLIYLLK